MTKKSLIVAGIICALLVTSAYGAAFPDVDEEAPYASAAEYLNQAGIMMGDENGNFSPDKTVTRGEMAAIICRMVGQADDLPSSEQFPDVPTDHWSNGYVTKAAELGIVNGYPDGNFGPGDTVTYEQVLTMIVRTVGLEDEAEKAGGYPTGYVGVAEEFGFTDGLSVEVGTPMARQQVAVSVYNVVK